MYLVMACKKANLTCEMGALTLMPLLGNLLAGCNLTNSFNPKGSKVVQQEQLINCGKSCTLLVCVNNVILELLSQLLPGSHITLFSGVCAADTKHCVYHHLLVIGMGVIPLPLLFTVKLRVPTYCHRIWVLLLMLMALVVES